jgi:hypothetical protein
MLRNHDRKLFIETATTLVEMMERYARTMEESHRLRGLKSDPAKFKRVLEDSLTSLRPNSCSTAKSAILHQFERQGYPSGGI